MASSKSPPGSVRRHGRNISHPMIRRSTRGPLDAPEDPLAETVTTSSAPSLPDLAASDASFEVQGPAQTFPEQSVVHQQESDVDLGFLQDPAIYHALPTDDVSPVFFDSPHQPPRGVLLAALLEGGHFRRAAETAVDQMLIQSQHAAEMILQLVYTRLACLILIRRPDLAAQEAAPLTDLLARNPPGAQAIVPLIPWELRLLLVRLQSLAATDGGRRGIMALYALAAEVRAHFQQASAEGQDDDRKLWSARLQDLGLRVVDALIEMGELETANRHLDTLTDGDANEIAYRKALLRLRVGDVAGARNYAQKLESDSRKAALVVLLNLADGEDTTEGWRDLLEQDPPNALLANNLAVSRLYAGHITEAQERLEDMLAQSPVFPGSLFNISTVYELCTEQVIDRKAELAQRLAARKPQPDSGGWERSNFDFKL